MQFGARGARQRERSWFADLLAGLFCLLFLQPHWHFFFSSFAIRPDLDASLELALARSGRTVPRRSTVRWLETLSGHRLHPRSCICSADQHPEQMRRQRPTNTVWRTARRHEDDSSDYLKAPRGLLQRPRAPPPPLLSVLTPAIVQQPDATPNGHASTAGQPLQTVDKGEKGAVAGVNKKSTGEPESPRVVHVTLRRTDDAQGLGLVFDSKGEILASAALYLFCARRRRNLGR
jgi:hypothetical protein